MLISIAFYNNIGLSYKEVYNKGFFSIEFLKDLFRGKNFIKGKFNWFLKIASDIMLIDNKFLFFNEIII
jgi:hypothetical protein